jgi:hypothetical protein
MHVTVSHNFSCTSEVFWRKVFFDPAYNDSLFKGHLGFPEYRVVATDEKPDRITRHVHVMPPQRAPEILRKMTSGSVTYEEHGTWTVSDGIYRFQTIPSFKPDKITIEGVMRTEPLDGGKRIRRVVDMDFTVRIMLVGGTVEKFLADEVRRSYDRSAGYTETWIAQKGLQSG